MKGSYKPYPGDLDVLGAEFTNPDLTRVTRLDEFGLEVVGQRLEPGRTLLARRAIAARCCG